MKNKKVTLKDLKLVFSEVLLNSYYHLQCIDKEIAALNIKSLDEATDEQKNKLHALTMTFVLINDLVHSGHKISKELLNKSYHPLIDSYMRRHAHSIEQKLVDPCLCVSCKDQNETQESSSAAH